MIDHTMKLMKRGGGTSDGWGGREKIDQRHGE